MSIKSDRWIREMAGEHGMIEPFEPGQVRVAPGGERIVSYGTSSYGYDVRCAREFRVFTNINSAIVDPKAFDSASFVDLEGETCIIPPNSFALARTVEYFRIPRNVLTVCLGKSTYARCFSGDTRVALADGRAPRLEDMARAAEGGERFFGYGMARSGEVSVVELVAPRAIGRDSLIELTLDNGRSVLATPDHEFLLRDGTMRRAGDLVPGVSLMPLYRSLRRGHEMTYQPASGRMTPTRRLVQEWSFRHERHPNSPASDRGYLERCPTDGTPHGGRGNASGPRRVHDAIPAATPVHDGAAEGIGETLSRLRRDDERYARHREARWMTAKAFRHPDRRPGTSDALRPRPVDAPEAGERWRQGRDAFRASDRAARAEWERRSRAVSGANHRVVAVRAVPGDHDVYCLSVPETGNFALEAGVFVSNCGIIVNVTPLEPEWEGHVTLEFSNTTPLPAKIYADEGIAQMLFLESDEVCETSYADRGGKYQGQRGVTLPRT